MTGQIETPIAEQNPSRWQKLMGWITAFEQAMAYDPQGLYRLNNQAPQGRSGAT